MSRHYGKKPELVIQLPPHTIEVAAPSAPPAPKPPEGTPVILPPITVEGVKEEDEKDEEAHPFVEWPEDSENDS